MLLPDVNVWLALTFDSHIHHPAAKSWFDSLSNNSVVWFCRLTQQGFLRVTTNAVVFGKDTLTMPDAWQKYDTFLSDPRISFAEEPAQIETLWRSFTQNRSFSPQVWNDAYLAAFALAAGLTIITFDRGFAQFQNVACTTLS